VNSRTAQDQAYLQAQVAVAQLKSSIQLLLSEAPKDGLRNSEIGRQLGIYMGHVEHVGHIPRTLLAIMESEGVVRQDRLTKLWRLVDLAERRKDERGDD
jgi:hypothetical protein